MIVIDASAILELLSGTERGDGVAERALSPDERLQAPHLLDIEVAQALRRLVQLKGIKTTRAEGAG